MPDPCKKCGGEIKIVPLIPTPGHKGMIYVIMICKRCGHRITLVQEVPK